MKEPIIINENGDVSFYCLKKDAELSIEVIDVQNNEYEAFDAEGKKLSFRIIDVNKVLIEEPQIVVYCQGKLKTIILYFFSQIEKERMNQFNKYSLDELIKYGAKKYGT